MVSKLTKNTVAKKELQKTAVKKTAISKAVPKKVVKKVSKNKGNFKALVCANDTECFWTNDGRVLQNLKDLHLAFGSMDDTIFLHHANTEKNDFADWVEYVLQDLDCALKLRTAKKRTQAEKILATQLKKYSL